MTATPTQVTGLDPEASTFLDLLVELGHLDETLLDLLNDQFLDLEGIGPAIGVSEVRRLVAATLFDRLDDMEAERRRALQDEWSLLFA